MATIPVAYYTGGTTTNAYKSGDQFLIGNDNTTDFNNFSGITFYGAPDPDEGWFIAYRKVSGATDLGFWGTKNSPNPLSNSAFLNLCNSKRRGTTPFRSPFHAKSSIDYSRSYFTNFTLENGSIEFVGNGNIATNLTGNAPGTGAFTYQFFVLVDDLDSTNGVCSTKSGNSDNGFDLDIDTSGNVVMSWASGNIMSTSSSPIQPRVWNHVAISRSGTTWLLFVNGVSGDTIENGQNLSSTNLLIGCSHDGDNRLRGKITCFNYLRECIRPFEFNVENAPTAPSTGTTFLCNAFYGDLYLVDESINAYTISSSGTVSPDRYNPFIHDDENLVLYLDAFVDSSFSHYSGGTTWYDLSKNGNNGTISGATFNTEGYFTFDGVNDKIVFGNMPQLSTGNTKTSGFNGKTGYTISVLFSPDELSNQGIAGWGDYTTTNQSTGMKLTATGVTNTWSGNDYNQAYTFQTGNTWYQVVMSYDGINRKIYINGQEPNCPGLPAPTVNLVGTDNFTVGVIDTNLYFKGKISQVLVHNVVLNEGEIILNYDTVKNRFN